MILLYSEAAVSGVTVLMHMPVLFFKACPNAQLKRFGQSLSRCFGKGFLGSRVHLVPLGVTS
jgi:hypothetical protein